MLFVFLLDADVGMSREFLSNNTAGGSVNNFTPTALDAAVYFMEYYVKLLYGYSLRRIVDESKTSRTKGSEHRTILFTFTTHQADVDGAQSIHGDLTLKSSWKDSQQTFFEELKNTLSKTKQEHHRLQHVPETAEDSLPQALELVSGKFEDFMDKFSASYFSSTNRHNGYFVWNEFESVFVFVMSCDQRRLELLGSKTKPSWQRKNVFIHLNAEKCTLDAAPPVAISALKDYFPYFPVPSLLHADKLAYSLHYANTKESFECPNMELLGKGGWIMLNTKGQAKPGYQLCLAKSLFTGHSKWPLPISLSTDSWVHDYPIVQMERCTEAGTNPVLSGMSFDEYVVYIPEGSGLVDGMHPDSIAFTLSIPASNGPIPIGFATACTATRPEAPMLFKFSIGPLYYLKLFGILTGGSEGTILDYLRLVPQFYESVLAAFWGEVEFSRRLHSAYERSGQQNTRPRISLPMPYSWMEAKAQVRPSMRQKSKAELTMFVDRAEQAHRRELQTRMLGYQTTLFPPLSRLKADALHFKRLLGRFDMELSVFRASCNAKVASEPHSAEFQLPNVVFKHCLPTHQMNDYVETMNRNQPLRPLFTEQEPDLLHLLKQMPQLAADLDSTFLVSGDIFGNPFKRLRSGKQRQRRRGSVEDAQVASSAADTDAGGALDAFDTNNVIDAASDAADALSAESELSAMATEPVLVDADVSMSERTPEAGCAIDEIDCIELEDIDTEIFMNGTIIFPGGLRQFGSEASIQAVDMEIVKSLVRSPGGLPAKQQFAETVKIIDDGMDLLVLKELCRRYKRHSLMPIVEARLGQISR